MTTQETQQQESQKAAAYKKYKILYDDYYIEHHWKPLQTYTITLDVKANDLPAKKHYAQVMDEAWDLFASGICAGDESVFIRACPLHPRPGLLESEAASNEDEFMEILSRIITTMLGPDPHDSSIEMMEPDGCIILQKFIPADASAVMAPGKYIIMGEGHDGVTASDKKDVVKVYMPTRDLRGWESQIFSKLDMDPEKHELEFVSKLTGIDKGHIKAAPNASLSHVRASSIQHESFITQLRGCDEHMPLGVPPKGVSINGMVPQGKVTVKEVFVVVSLDEMDKLEAWAKDNMNPDAVVQDINGNMLSHAAGVCRTAGIPYIISKVSVGDTWTEAASGWVTKKKGFKPKPYDPQEYIVDYMAGISTGLFKYARQYGWLSNHFHQFLSAPLSNPKDTAYLGGVFTGWLVNASLSVGLGEARHMFSQKKNTTPLNGAALKAMYQNHWTKSDWSQPDDYYPSNVRSHYYYTIENVPVTMKSIRANLTWLIKLYETGWHGSYGGEKYKVSCENARTLLDAIMALLDSDKKDRANAFNEVVAWANKTENNVHNTGYFFNKFMSKQALDWGTDNEKISPTMDLFNVFYAAKAAIDVRKDKLPKLIDTTPIVDYALLRWSPSAQKKYPMWLDEKAPQVFKDIVEAASKGYDKHVIHYGGKHSTTSSPKNYIQCGHPECSSCNKVKNQIHIQPLGVEQAYEMIAVLDSGVEYDMVLPDSSTKKPIDISKAVNTNFLNIVHKEIKEQGQEYWLGADGMEYADHTPLYKEMVKVYAAIQFNNVHPMNISADTLKVYTKIVGLMPSDILMQFSKYAVTTTTNAVELLKQVKEIGE
tara:strand:+ start:188 stop:2656 length:2469 start_codon:yes stop_codon:yes gene_type:complete